MDKHRVECRFCGLAQNLSEKEFDTPILESQNYIAIASIGAFIEGWTLIVPKKHQYSMATDYAKSEYWEFADRVARLVRNRYGQVIHFEHGAEDKGSLVGCGVDHAHAHVVPYSLSLRSTLMSDEDGWVQCSAESISDLTNGEDYLFYADAESKGREGVVLVGAAGRSQYFRRMLAELVGLSDFYDYKAHPFTERSLKTVQQLSAPSMEGCHE